MVLNNLTYYPIFGIPLIVYGGASALMLLISAAVVGSFNLRGKSSLKTHKLLAGAGILIGFVHGLLAILSYF